MTKKETLTIKVSIDEKEFIKKATEMKSVSVSSFARMLLLEKAREIIFEKLREENGSK